MMGWLLRRRAKAALVNPKRFATPTGWRCPLCPYRVDGGVDPHATWHLREHITGRPERVG